jgi:hypothetical protein
MRGGERLRQGKRWVFPSALERLSKALALDELIGAGCCKWIFERGAQDALVSLGIELRGGERVA